MAMTVLLISAPIYILISIPKFKLRSEMGLLNTRQAEADGGGHRGDRQDDAARAVEAGERDIHGVSPEAGDFIYYIDQLIIQNSTERGVLSVARF